MADQKRQYRMKRRAELEAQTRLRIAESAAALHEAVGPAQTSISAIAERGCPPFDRLPALPRRGRALRRLQRALACGEPGAGGRAVAGDRRPARSPEGGARGAVRLLPADGAHVREPPPRREDDAHGAADVRRLPGLPRGGRRGVDAWTGA